MSLETVELIMDVEKHFGIDVPNEDAALLTKVGDIRDYVVAAMQRQGRPMSREQCFDEIREILATFGVKPEDVHPESNIVSDLGID